MYTREEENLIVLASFEALTAKHLNVLYSGFEKTLPDFEKHGSFLIKSVGEGVYNKIRSNFGSLEYRTRLFNAIEARNITCVTVFSPDYPERLKHIYNPPAVLFCKGNVKLLKDRLFAAVGSRRSLQNVLKQCTAIVSELTGAFTIVTGLADGGDTAVIEGAKKSGRIISVLAYGFDHVYPAVNAQLLKSIEENGLVVTEYVPSVPPKRFNFLERNRIIAGLSEGVLVVSAGKKSGALNTAAHAVEAGRSVFAFPYSLGITSGEGCNALIKDGARLVTEAKDILDEYGFEYKPEKARELTADEIKVYAYLKEFGDAYVHVMAEELEIPAYKLIAVLSMLEIDNFVVRLGGNKYSAL